MRIIFMGTPDFAVPSLQILLEAGYDIAAVISAPDKYGGRGRKQLIESPVKQFAVQHHIRVLQPKNLKEEDFLSELKGLKADLQIVVAFRMLPVAVWDMPPMGTMNLHASLLPSYRGAAPINWAIINGETKTGLTTFLLKHEIDTGDILLQREVPIYKTDTAGDLHDRMMPEGAELVLESVKLLESGEFKLRPQEANKVSKAPKIFHEDCCIDFDQPVKKVYDFIRGLSPYPGAWTRISGKEVKIYQCRFITEKASPGPGKIQTDQKTFIRIGCRDGLIQINSLKMEGKRKMEIRDFLNGFELEADSVDTLNA